MQYITCTSIYCKYYCYVGYATIYTVRVHVYTPAAAVCPAVWSRDIIYVYIRIPPVLYPRCFIFSPLTILVSVHLAPCLHDSLEPRCPEQVYKQTADLYKTVGVQLNVLTGHKVNQRWCLSAQAGQSLVPSSQPDPNCQTCYHRLCVMKDCSMAVCSFLASVGHDWEWVIRDLLSSRDTNILQRCASFQTYMANSRPRI